MVQRMMAAVLVAVLALGFVVSGLEAKPRGPVRPKQPKQPRVKQPRQPKQPRFKQPKQPKQPRKEQPKKEQPRKDGRNGGNHRLQGGERQESIERQKFQTKPRKVNPGENHKRDTDHATKGNGTTSKGRETNKGSLQNKGNTSQQGNAQNKVTTNNIATAQNKVNIQNKANAQNKTRVSTLNKNKVKNVNRVTTNYSMKNGKAVPTYNRQVIDNKAQALYRSVVTNVANNKVGSVNIGGKNIQVKRVGTGAFSTLPSKLKYKVAYKVAGIQQTVFRNRALAQAAAAQLKGYGMATEITEDGDDHVLSFEADDEHWADADFAEDAIELAWLLQDLGCDVSLEVGN